MPMMKEAQPRRPAQLPEYSEICLRALVERGLARKISLGGGLGILHYLDYRTTRDVDAWWAEDAGSEDRRRVTEVIRSVLRSRGEVEVRAWGDVVSIELQREGRKVFSFQIARLSARLMPSERAPWIDVPLDSLPDLVAGKMVALVERGAPRDFRDIHALCEAGLATPNECWSLWEKREKLAQNDADVERARLAVATHLTRIIQHRRLDQIDDPQARSEAARVRGWFGDVFLAKPGEAK
jgi:hypothetical protein